MRNTSNLMALLTLTVSFSALAIQEQKLKGYDGTNFNEVVCRFYMNSSFGGIGQRIRRSGEYVFAYNADLETYDLLAQIYRSSDSKLYFSIYSGFLKNKLLEFNSENIPSGFVNFKRREDAHIKLNETLSNESKAEKIYDLDWYMDKGRHYVSYEHFLSVKAMGSICKEIFDNTNTKVLTLDLLTTSFYAPTNPNYIEGVKEN